MTSTDDYWRYFPCVYCGVDIDTHDRSGGWVGVGQGADHDSYAHSVCDPEKLREQVTKYKSEAGWAERVCYAEFRLRLGYHQTEDLTHLEQALIDWYRQTRPHQPDTDEPFLFWQAVKKKLESLS